MLPESRPGVARRDRTGRRRRAYLAARLRPTNLSCLMRVAQMSHVVEACPFRWRVERRGSAEVARCRFLDGILRTDRVSLPVSREACERCRRLGPPARNRIHSVTASLLYKISGRIAAAGGCRGCTLAKAERLRAFAIDHLLEVASRPPTDAPAIVILQSCDVLYLPLLRATSATNREYAEKHGYAYHTYVGNLSPIPHTSSFNRYYLIRREIKAGRFDWALWLDSDALVMDHGKRLESIIEKSPEKMLIACRGGRQGEHDINAGVLFLNLRHRQALSMVEYVIGECERIDPSRDAGFWCVQCHLHRWLSQHGDQHGKIPLLQRYTDPDANLFNYDGPFIWHVLREHGPIEKRTAELERLSARSRSARPP